MWLTTVIGAICTLIFLSLGWAIVWDTAIQCKPKYYHFCISRVIPVIVCMLVVLFYWDKYVALFPSNDPWKQPLRTGTAAIRIVIDSDSNSAGECDCLECASIQMWKSGEFLLEMVTLHSTYRQIGNNEVLYEAIVFNLDTRSKLMGKPLSCLADVNYAQIFFLNETRFPRDQKIKVKSGQITLTFNSSVYIEIPIPAQTARFYILVPDIQKYFKKGSKK